MLDTGNIEVQLHISSEHLRQLRKVSEETYPEEACGLLFGRKREEYFEVDELRILPNADKARGHFTIDPTILYKTLMDAEKRELSLVAIFHSHPIGPHPSGIDRKYMQFWPVPWLIFSTTHRKFGAFISLENRDKAIKIEATS